MLRYNGRDMYDQQELQNKIYLQGTVQTLCLIGLTSGKMPMIMSNWKHLLPEEAHTLQDELISRLEDISAEVDKRNEVAGKPGQRPKKCQTFNPKYHETSVSL